MFFFERVHPRLSSSLDGLRWVAAGLVVVSHVRSMVLANWPQVASDHATVAMKLLYLLTSFGHQAVILFFVLSGFLVGGSVVNDIRRERFSFPLYLVNRISRLYVVLIPALILGWACDVIGSTWFNASGIYTYAWPQPLWALQFNVVERMTFTIASANVFNLQTIVEPTFGSNGPLWSLANEFWYYLLFPLCLIPWVRGRAWFVRLSCLFLAIVAGVLVYPEILLYGAVWVMGVAIRFIPRPLIPWSSASVVLTVVAMLLCVRLPHWYPGSELFADGILAVFIANLLLTLMHHPHPASALPGGRIHSAIADFSFSLYLLHFPMLVLLCAMSQAWLGIGLSMQPNNWLPLIFMTVVIVMLYVYAWAISLVTERYTSLVRELLTRWFRVDNPRLATTPMEQPTPPTLP
jgi:peptidoglycan/LPS O-acetylase OafA/YrhL